MNRNPLSPRPLARMTAHYPWRTIMIWIVLLGAILGLSSAFAPSTTNPGEDFQSTPDSVVGEDLINQHFGEDICAQELLVVASSSLTVDDPGFRSVVETTIDNLGPWQGDIASITNFYDLPADAPDANALVSDDRRSLLVPITFNGEPDDYVDRGESYLEESRAASNTEVNVYAVGDISGNQTFGKIVSEDLGKDFSIGLPVAGVVLVVVFGALIAVFLPLIVGVVAIALTTGAVALLSNWFPVDDTTTITMSMIGLAVGIDYALFFLERFREERRHGAPKVDAVEHAGATAGKAVLFSGATVILALGGLLLLPFKSFQVISLSVALVVVVAVAAALTLLPAMLRLLGDAINFPRIGTMRKLRRQDKTGIREFEVHRGQGLWGHLANVVMRRPAAAILITTAVLLLCTLPVLTMNLGQAGDATLPDTPYKQGFLILARDFDAGLDAPMLIVVDGDARDATISTQVETFVTRLSRDDRFGDVRADVSTDNELTRITAVTHEDPYSENGKMDVNAVRDEIVPSVFGANADNVYVTGNAAANVDFNETLTTALPRVFAFVFALSFLLLMLAFRTIVIPAVSIILNMLSVGAAYGMVVAVFQHGWGADLAGFTQVDAISSWLPVMLFCILFGLSMDYHVFLLSRVREHFDHTHNNEESVAFGLQSTGRIITGAALIMVAVFGSFAAGRLADIQQMGFGLGFAILIDATLIRTILVPATLKLLGNANWYFPRWLHWLPDLRVEGDLPPINLKSRQHETVNDAAPVPAPDRRVLVSQR